MWIYTLDPKPPGMKLSEMWWSMEANGRGITSFPTLHTGAGETKAYVCMPGDKISSLHFTAVCQRPGGCERWRGGNISSSVSRRRPLGGRSYQKSQQKSLILPLSGSPLSGIPPLMLPIEEEEDGTESPYCSTSGSGWLPCGVSSTRHQALPEHPT